MLSPLQWDMPMKTSEPTPAAMSPGTRINGSVAPPSPAASMTSTADTIGEPKMTEIAARLPAAASTVTSCGGASRLTRATVYIASPAPSVMRGASGPRTSPKPMLAQPASTTPGTMLGWVPPICRPWAGTCPPAPGRRSIANATGKPATPSTSRYHHDGIESHPKSSGRSVNSHCWV